MYKITLDQYPDFEEYKKYLEPPQEQWILKYPDKEWDEDENPGVAFYDAEEKCVYFEAGSHPWESLVASNHLSGSDAVPPTQIRFEEMALQVFKAAEQKRDPATMKMWLPLMPMLYALFEQGLLPGTNAFAVIVHTVEGVHTNCSWGAMIEVHITNHQTV